MKYLSLLLPLLFLGSAPRAPFTLQDLLPDTTLLFAETPSASEFRQAFKKTPLSKFFEDEEIKDFAGGAFDAALKNFQGFTKEFEKELGVPWEKAWEIPTGQIAFAMPALMQEGGQSDVVLTLDCAGKRDVLLKGVAYARKTYEARSGKKIEAWKAGDHDVASGELSPGIRFHLAVIGDTLIASSWKGTMEQIAAAARGGQPKPLSASATFKKAREKAGAKEVFFYGDVGTFVKSARENLGDPEKKFISALGLDGFTYAAGGLAFGEKSVTERFFLGTSAERKGLAKFLSLKGPASGFEAAPANALQFLSVSIDVAELYDTFLEMLKATDEFQHQEILDQVAEFEKEAGFTLKGDLFPAFGPRVSSYAAFPPDGLVPDGVATFEIKDAARFDKCLKSVLRNIPAELGELDFQGRKINYFRFQQPGGFEPGRMFLSMLYWLREGDRLVVSGLVPLSGGYGAANALKRHLLREKQPRLSDGPSVRDWLGGKTDGASFVLYLDIGRAFTALYNTLAPLGVYFRDTLRGDGAGVDLVKMPLGETVGKYLGQTVHRVTVEADGLRVDGISASGTSLMTAVYLGAAGVVLFPAITRAGEEAKLSQCKSQASTVFFAMFSYHGEKKKFPDKTGAEFLKQLKDAGFLEEDPACPYAGPGTFRGPAKDVNGLADTDVIFCDEPTNHPDGSITVLRKSGEMETLRSDHPEYKKALETTKGK